MLPHAPCLLQELLSGLEAGLQPFLGPQAQATIEQLEPLQRAQAQLAAAAAAHRALQLLLRASGVDPQDHESRKEQVGGCGSQSRTETVEQRRAVQLASGGRRAGGLALAGTQRVAPGPWSFAAGGAHRG